MLKIYRKIHKFCSLMEYFSANAFKFDNENVRALAGKLESTDKQLFAFDMRNLNWTELFQLSLVGVRQYVVKDDPSTIPESVKRHERYVEFFIEKKKKLKPYCLSVCSYVSMTIGFWVVVVI